MLTWMPLLERREGGSKQVKAWSWHWTTSGTSGHTVFPSLHCWAQVAQLGLRSEVSSLAVAELLVRREEWSREPPPLHRQRKMVSQDPADGSWCDVGTGPPGRLIWNASKRISCFQALAPDAEAELGRRQGGWNSSSHPPARRVCLTPQGCCVPPLSRWFAA